MTNNYDLILERFVRMSKRIDDIRLVMVIGSRARNKVPADEWSDLDVVLATSEPDKYILEYDWIQDVGEYILTFTEETLGGDLIERRVLFEGGFDVDFIPVPVEFLRHGLPPEASEIIERGSTVVLDKDNLALAFHSAPETRNIEVPLSQKDFEQVASDFLYHVVWCAKKLCRGELWTAKQCCDGYLKWLLLKVIEWYAKWTSNDPDSVDIWHSGRFLDTWADPSVMDGLTASFARYDIDDVWEALIQTKNLYDLLIRELVVAISVTDTVESSKKIDILLKRYHERR